MYVNYLSPGQLEFSFPNKCDHLLRNADYNQRQELSFGLDKQSNTTGDWYELSKLFPFVDEQTRVHMYLSYFGGGCPAMNFLTYMSTGPKQMNVGKLIENLTALEMKSAAQYLCEHLSATLTTETLLHNLPYSVLLFISTELSEKPYLARNL